MSRTDSESGSGDGTAGAGTSIVNSVDQMMKLPLQMTGATWDFMMQGMRNVTGTGRQPKTTETNSMMSPEQAGLRSESSEQVQTRQNLNTQDLGGDDLKYVTWSLIFTKPGFECLLEPQRSELVNYAADVPSFAAVKIAKFVEKARHGHAEKPESWREYNYPPPRTETASDQSSTTSSSSATSNSSERGWRIPQDDQKYIVFLHRVEWRLPKQEEVTRVERVTIERGTTRVA